MNLGSVGFAGTETRYAADVAGLDDRPQSTTALGLTAELLGLPAAALLDGLAARVVRGGSREAVAAARTRRQVGGARQPELACVRVGGLVCVCMRLTGMFLAFGVCRCA